MKHLLEEAKQMIRIGSVSTSGDEELANYVNSLVASRGLKTQLQQVMHSLENVGKRQFNVIGILGDPLVDKKTRKGLLLNTHLDTSSPGLVENWTQTEKNPFAATVKDGKIYGLGAADAKLDFLCKLHAVARFREKKLKMPVYLVGTCGEELGMFGARYLIKSMALNPRYVVVGGPSALKIVYAHKCLDVFRVSIGFQMVERDARGFNRRIDLHSFGKSSHGAYPYLGVNAVSQTLDFLQAAVENGFEVRFTQLGGGDALNKVPDSAKGEFYLTSHQFEDFKRFFREFVRIDDKENAFRVELGGLGDRGVRFLPEAVFPALMDITGFFKNLASGFEKNADESYDPPYSTVNFAQLKQRLGGMDLFFDLRLLPGRSPEETEKQIVLGIQAIASRYPNLNIAVAREGMNPGLSTPLQGELVNVCKEAMEAAGIELAFGKKSESTEASQFSQAGYETVVFGPGVSQGNSRSPNEHISIDQLEKAVAFYEKLIEKVCL